MGIAAHRTPIHAAGIEQRSIIATPGVDRAAHEQSLTLLLFALLTTMTPREPPAPPAPRRALLTGREMDVLQLVTRGLTNAAIADRLFISPCTVAQHLQSIYGKLGVTSRTAAAHVAYRDRLCP